MHEKYIFFWEHERVFQMFKVYLNVTVMTLISSLWCIETMWVEKM